MAPPAQPAAAVPSVLVVEDNAKVREVVRVVLGLEGVAVSEAGSLREARRLLGRHVEAVVLDRQLPDGDGLDLLPDLEHFCPEARVVVFSSVDDGRQPPALPRVDKGDLPGLTEALRLAPPPPASRSLLAAELVADEADDVVRSWRELCRWDPELALSEPPGAAAVVAALGDALGRPQPLGWGVDPAVETTVEVFAAGLEASVAVGQLACLGEALRRLVGARVPPDEVFETMSRLQMVLARATGVVLRTRGEGAAGRLPGSSHLGDRAALVRALDRELARTSRHGRSSTLLVVRAAPAPGGVLGEPAAPTGGLADALAAVARRSDSAYADGEAVAVILPESGIGGARAILGRARDAVGSDLVWAACHLPGDGDDPSAVLALAAERLRDDARTATRRRPVGTEHT